MQLRGRSMWRPGVRAERRPRRTVSSSRLLRVHAPRDLGRDRRALPRLQRLRPGRRQERLRLALQAGRRAAAARRRRTRSRRAARGRVLEPLPTQGLGGRDHHKDPVAREAVLRIKRIFDVDRSWRGKPPDEIRSLRQPKVPGTFLGTRWTQAPSPLRSGRALIALAWDHPPVRIRCQQPTEFARRQRWICPKNWSVCRRRWRFA